ncbi:MAG: phosphopantetheine-binding protein [Phycisphaeraceae bacterium]
MSEAGAVTSTVDRVRLMLREDLKLGDDVVVEPDMPLFGGELDLDSLDVLLLVSSIEKAFKIKIPNEDVGRQVFTSVRTLADYLDAKGAKADGEPDAQQDAAAMDGEALLTQLPHGEGFRFVDRIEAMAVGRAGRGVWVVNGEEAFFAGHFPGRAIVPGVLISEALAQLSGIVGLQTQGEDGSVTNWHGGQLAHVDVRFREEVKPPAELVLDSRMVKVLGALQHFEVRATVAGNVVAEGTVALNRRSGS